MVMVIAIVSVIVLVMVTVIVTVTDKGIVSERKLAWFGFGA